MHKRIIRNEFINIAKWSELFNYCRAKYDRGNLSISDCIESIENINGEISDIIKKTDKSLGEIFSLENSIEIKLGDERFFKTGTNDYQSTIKFARNNPGKYPLFSSQVDGPVEFMEHPRIKPILFDKKNINMPLISWNIKGDPCRDIRLHKEPFYVTENRGLIEIVDSSINIYYVLYFLREHMVEMGGFSRSNEAHAGKVKSLRIKIPLDSKGNIDVDKQSIIAANYEKVLNFKHKIKLKIDEINDNLSNIDPFK